jgi:mono/diheme cytochrome c family protein
VEIEMKATRMFAVMFVWLAGYAIASAQPIRPVSRGELLYTTHCIACHTTKLHWRDEKLAKDWASLNSQVRRWQKNSELKWSDDDIAEVARYLNANYYHFSEPAD